MPAEKRQASHRSPGEVVMVYAPPDSGAHSHDKATQRKIAEQLASLLGRPFAGDYEASHSGHIYLVPNDTLVGMAQAQAFGIHSEQDLFGGVVPHAFMATKAITHPLMDAAAQAPPGWSQAFARRVAGSVLAGYSAFTLQDARRAGLKLLEHGPVRVKSVRAKAGLGQTLVCNPIELEAALGAIVTADLPHYGVVLEEHLNEVKTCSVGQVRVGDFVASYCGTQRLTKNGRGEEVYGGSDLLVARGDFEALAGLGQSAETRLTIEQAERYDTAAMDCFTGMFASRRNYDVAQGLNAAGTSCSGVLEQSWRIGGASSAEMLALLAFRDDAKLRAVKASSVEIYGACEAPPPHATVYFRGLDEHVGPMTKYAVVEPYADA
jgi:hypothetical protein